MEYIKQQIKKLKSWLENTPSQKLLVIAGLLCISVYLFSSTEDPEHETKVRDLEHIEYTDFLKKAEEGDVKSVKAYRYNILRVTMSDGSEVKTNYKLFPEEKIIDRMLEYGVPVDSDEKMDGGASSWNIGGALPLLLMSVLIYVVIKQSPRELWRNTSKANVVKKVKERFSDIAGNEQAKAEIMETVDYLKDPQKFRRNGARTPKGILMAGPPGTGKTLLAKATAGEAGVTFIQCSGSEFTGIYVGLGVMKVKQMFETARKNKPCIVFIDEFDALGGKRGANRSHNEDDRTINHLLAELDGFKESEDIVFMAATNNPDKLDPAVTRPGRIDRKVTVGLPKMKARKEIAELHARKIDNLDADFDFISKITSGFSGAEIENLTNEAVMLANRSDDNTVTTRHYEDALESIVIGPKHEGDIVSGSTKRVSEVHEAGHAIVGRLCPHHPNPYKVSVMARGNTGGVTMFLKDNDETMLRKTEIEERLAVLMAGRAAEEIIFGKDMVSSGASDDIKKATELADAYVRELGFSKLGVMSLAITPDKPAFGGLAVDADREVRSVIDEAYKKAFHILNENKDALNDLASALRHEEVIDGDVVSKCLKDAIQAEATLENEKTIQEDNTVAHLDKAS